MNTWNCVRNICLARCRRSYLSNGLKNTKKIAETFYKNKIEATEKLLITIHCQLCSSSPPPPNNHVIDLNKIRFSFRDVKTQQRKNKITSMTQPGTAHLCMHNILCKQTTMTASVLTEPNETNWEQFQFYNLYNIITFFVFCYFLI